MAVLYCVNLKGSYRLELVRCNSTSNSSDTDSYRVLLYFNEACIYDKTHTVAGWQSGHFYVYLISNAFRRCQMLVDKDVGFNIYSRNDPTSQSYETACIDVDTDWLGFTLFGTRVKRFRNDPVGQERIVGKAYLRLSEDTIPGAEEALWFRFGCTVEEAVAFGDELAKEAAEAAANRARLLSIDETSYDPFLPGESELELDRTAALRAKWHAKRVRRGHIGRN